jgi:hypothetical protein
MPTNFIVGNDGNISFPSTTYSMNVRAFAANVAYVESQLTGFAHTGTVRRLGIADITGSLTGTPTRDTGTPFGTVSGNALPSQPGGTLTLSLTGGTTTSGTAAVLLQFDAVFSQYAFSTDKNGDSTLSVNFGMNDTNGPTVVWTTS